jgi:Flp pilus assembly pilin Flp
MKTQDGEAAATAVEYALLAGLIAAVIATSAALLGQSVVAAFESVRTAMGW